MYIYHIVGGGWLPLIYLLRAILLFIILLFYLLLSGSSVDIISIDLYGKASSEHINIFEKKNEMQSSTNANK